MSLQNHSTQYPKVLIITRNAWNNNNCTGNTLSNFFRNWPKDKLANIYCRAETINNPVCNMYYRITEQELIRNIKNRSFDVGEMFFRDGHETEEHHIEQDISSSKKMYGFFSRHRWTLALWARDLIWDLGKWKNEKLEKFLKDFSPDVIYMPCYDSVYMHKILWYVKKITKAKIVLFTGDDTYTLKQFNLSPLYWINRLIDRKTMRKSVKMAETLFVISDLQKQEYDKIFKRECVILRKGGDFNKEFAPKEIYGTPLRLVYTGNIHSGRWRTLAKMAEAIKKINADGQKIQLDIYTLSARNQKMIEMLEIDGASRLMPPATDAEIKQALLDADVLVFVEPFELKEKLKWRLSFSTKIVDYLASSRAILAVGPDGLSSMDYLKRFDAAICVNDIKSLHDKLLNLANNPQIVQEYAKKSWDCGKENNNMENTEMVLYNGLMRKKNDQK